MSGKTVIAMLLAGLGFVASNVMAAPNGPFVNLGANIVYGPSTISINNSAFGNGTTYANGNPNALFSLANDGRFKYGSSIGYVHDNIGISLKYHNLGSQHLMGVNGASLANGESGSYKAMYYGVNATAFFPINDKKEDIFLSLGGGRLKTELSANSAQFVGAGTKQAIQNESVLFLGVGMRHYINSTLSVDVEYDRLTPITHGLLSNGTYNNSFGIFSAGLTLSF